MKSKVMDDWQKVLHKLHGEGIERTHADLYAYAISVCKRQKMKATDKRIEDVIYNACKSLDHYRQLRDEI